MKTKNWWRTGVALLAAGVLLTGCASNGGSSDSEGAGGDTDSGELIPITWMSPRGSIDVMDDYQMHVAIEMGYFEEMGFDVTMEPGPADGSASTKFVAEGNADISGPSPGILASSIDSGVEVIGIYNLISGQIFNFAVAPDSDIESFADLEGKTIAVQTPAWQLIIDPMLIEAGVDPSSVSYVEAGAQYGQSVVMGQADAALGWEGMRAQWEGQGLDVKWILGKDSSNLPSNSYVVAVSELESDEGKEKWTNFLKALVMGEEFAAENPAAAAQITYERLPELAGTLEPQAAIDAMREIQGMYQLSFEAGEGWGWHNPAGWATFLDIAYEMGQTSRLLAEDEVYTNELLQEANNVDADAARADASAFELNEEFASVSVN